MLSIRTVKKNTRETSLFVDQIIAIF